MAAVLVNCIASGHRVVKTQVPYYTSLEHVFSRLRRVLVDFADHFRGSTKNERDTDRNRFVHAPLLEVKLFSSDVRLDGCDTVLDVLSDERDAHLQENDSHLKL